MSRPRYWVFAWEFSREPNGGARDFKRAYAQVEQAGAYLTGWLVSNSTGDGYVWDSETFKEIHPTTYDKGVG